MMPKKQLTACKRRCNRLWERPGDAGVDASRHGRAGERVEQVVRTGDDRRSPSGARTVPLGEPRPRRRNGDAVDRLLGSTSLAHLTGAMPAKTAPAMPPRVPLAGAA
jgi:hypothetical protein